MQRHIIGASAGVSVEPLQRFGGDRGRQGPCDVEPRQRAHPHRPRVAAEVGEERELHVGPLLDTFGEVVKIVAVIKLTYELLLVVDDPEPPIVVIDVAVIVHQTHVQRRHVGEAVDLAAVLLVEVVEHLQTQRSVVDDLVDGGQSVLATQESVHFGRGEALVHAAGHRADAVHTPSEDGLDDLLAPLAQPNNTFDETRVGLDQSDEVALLGCGVDPEQHLRHHQVEIGRDV